MSLREFNSVLLAGGTLLLAACATIPPPDYPRDHPANSDAQAEPIQAPSGTLSSYRAEGVGSKGDAAPTDTPSGHAGHGAKGQLQETPQEGRHDDQ
jgi:hypothetical protein